MLENKLRQWTIVEYDKVLGWNILTTFPFDKIEEANKWLKDSITTHGEPIYSMAKVVNTIIANIMVLESRIDMEQTQIKMKKRLVKEYKRQLDLLKEKLVE